ncbi:LCP family protein [Smaragdicoccus niigatensis]|uniref:LCP family protein n=1 Tax=Smaragdicoccus niigatensis TaxID=359359 RepID=UPI00059015BF|nr:LCP family protein [Smaragdicoccus niigatensis]
MEFSGRPKAARRLRALVAVISTLTLVITGSAWYFVDAVQSGLAKFDLGLGGVDDGATDILLVGTDSRTDAHGNPLSASEIDSLHAGPVATTNTDTIILVRIPDDGSSATAINIPRDSYVAVPGFQGKIKINSAYGSTKQATWDRLVAQGQSPKESEPAATEAGRKALIHTVEDLTGQTIDHYAEVGLLGFVLLTDAVGGVDVCLRNSVDEPLSGADFRAGEQILRGSQALSFVRQRHELPRGDLDRIVRQQVFMASLASKVLSQNTLSDPSKLSLMRSAINRSVVLDDNWDVFSFAGKLAHMAGGDVSFQTIPVVDAAAMTDQGESIVKVDPAQVKKFVAGLLTKNDPVKDANGDSVTSVDVWNDTGIGGLASAVSAQLTGLGFHEGDVGNNKAKHYAKTTVLVKDRSSDVAQDVARKLGGLPIVEDPDLPDTTVRVVLSGDYRGPGSDRYHGPSYAKPGWQKKAAEKAAANSETDATGAPKRVNAAPGGPRCVN